MLAFDVFLDYAMHAERQLRNLLQKGKQMSKKQEVFNLWFVKFYNRTNSDQVVFNFTLPQSATEGQAFEHGRTMFNVSQEGVSYANQYTNGQAEIVCRTTDTVICFEPC